MIATLMRLVRGDFQPREIQRYLAFEAGLFWGLIFPAWMSYPSEHKYSIMTHTLSFLGSFNSEHNPKQWWIFSIAMMSWGLGTIPVALYLHRRFLCISKWGARLGAFLMIVGCFGVCMVAVFPDARGRVIGEFEWTEIHEKAALLIVVGFTLGIVCLGLMLLKDCLLGSGRGPAPCLDHRRLMWPYVMWTSVTGMGVFFQIRWGHVYAEMKAAAAASGKHIGSPWAEGLNTRYSFPLWEHLLFYALFIFLIWFTSAVSSQPQPPGENGGK